jgi:leucyl-tRNA synthetase
MTGAYVDEGLMVNSGPFNGLESTEGREQISNYLETQYIGKKNH